MQSTRIVPRPLAALALAACVGLGSPAPTWADTPVDRPLVSSSVPVRRAPLAEASDPASSPEQVQEAADYLLSEMGAALRCLVFTMINWDLPTTPNPPPTPPPPPDTFVPLSVQPPPSLTDDPGNGPPPPPPPPHQSPEPGTLIVALAGAGAIAYRYRRRRTKVADVRGKEEVSEKEVELAM